MRNLVVSLGCGLLLAVGCGDDDSSSGPDAAPDATAPGPVAPFPDSYCPGSAGCTGTGDGVFKVGFGKASIVPVLVETEWTDDNDNGEFDSGEDYVDANGNDEFDPYWIAGFGTGRPAIGVSDGIWVRAIAFEHNDVRVAIAIVDSVGWFLTDIEPSLEDLPAALELDHVLVGSTHDHESIDTIGQWGRNDVTTGIDPDYIAFVRQATVDAVTDAVAALEPATMGVATAMTVDEGGSSLQYVGDRRDPVTLDPTVTIIRFASTTEPERTVASLVHWSAHPEYGGGRNNLISSDYAHWLRDTVENGAPATASEVAVDGIGGECLFVNGAIGGQIGDNGVEPNDSDGNPITDEGLHKSARIGVTVGRLALQAITSAEDVTDVADPALSFRTGKTNVGVENVYFHVAVIVGLFNRSFFGYDPDEPIDVGNYPYLESRVTYLQIGSVGIATAPGELDPGLAIGGYDGSQAWGDDFIDSDNEEPPDLTKAPGPPYLNDLIRENPGVDFPLVFGMTEDYIGYIVPDWNYVLHSQYPYLERSNGVHHYEETQSVGPLVEEQAVGAMRDIIRWRPPAD